MTADLLWTEATRDLDAELAQKDAFVAKQATADLWTFLALARSDEEFEHRLAMISDEVDQRVAPQHRQAVFDGFRENFRLTGAKTDEESEEDDDDKKDDEDELNATGGLQVWHVASQRWITAAAEPGAQNPAYFSGGEELGPNTFNTGNYPVEVGGPDPWNPMNGNAPMPPSSAVQPANRFPAEPQPWSTPPDKQWGENPMQFPTGPGLQYRQSAQAPMQPSVPNPGWQQPSNPEFFGQGNEGVASQDGQYPEDIALPEPDDRVDAYQTQSNPIGDVPGMTPEFSGPPVQTVNYPQYVTGSWHEAADSSNVGACAADDCGRPVYRKGKKWEHLEPHLRGNHKVLLYEDHPYVQQQRAAMRHTAPGGGEHAPYRIKKVDGGYAVFNDKGERKNDEAKSYGEARRFQKGLYKNVPGAKGSAEQDEQQKTSARGKRRRHAAARGTGPHTVISDEEDPDSGPNAEGYSFRQGEQVHVTGYSPPDADGKVWAEVRHPRDRRDVGFLDPDNLRPHRQASAHPARFFDPRLAADQQPQTDGTGGMAGGGSSGGSPASQGVSPPVPPSMRPGGPGSQAMGPMGGHPGGGVPQPGTQPGGPTSAPAPPTPPKPGTTAMLDPSVASFFHHAEGLVRERPSVFNPSGIADPYDEATWNGPAQMQPRQPAHEMHVNTPQKARQPIPQIGSDTMQRDEGDEEEEEG